jgi:hypothetical protein
VLHDFNYKWRHILRRQYNDLIFRRLARAIIRIATMDFNIVEISSVLQRDRWFPVSTSDYPEWGPFDSHVVQIGRLSIVLSQDLASCLRIIREDFADQKWDHACELSCKDSSERRTYLVVSVRHIVLCQMDHHALAYTRPEPLFDGKNPPSSEAIRLLLIATCCRFPRTPIHKLPLELQEMILRSVSPGNIEGARLGCLLNLGPPFSWKNGRWVVRRREGYRIRNQHTPIDSQIWFGDYCTGVAYTDSW